MKGMRPALVRQTQSTVTADQRVVRQRAAQSVIVSVIPQSLGTQFKFLNFGYNFGIQERLDCFSPAALVWLLAPEIDEQNENNQS